MSLKLVLHKSKTQTLLQVAFLKFFIHCLHKNFHAQKKV